MGQAEDDRERLLTAAFVELADTLVDDYDVIDVLDRLVAHSVKLLAAEAAGIMLVGPQARLRVVASSTGQPGLTELMQIEADEGPCVDCVRTGTLVAVTDLANASERWPRLTAALAGGGGYRSVHALPLRLRGEAIGGMNLFHPPRAAPTRRPASRTGFGRHRHHRHPPGTRHPPRRGRRSTAHDRAHQPGGHRAGQGRTRAVRRPHRGAAFDQLRRYTRSRNLLLGDVARAVVTDRGFAQEILASGG